MKTYIGTTRQIYKDFTEDNKSGQYDLEKQYVCEVKELKGKSDAQRSRYWATIREVAKLVNESQWYVHNKQLYDLGITEKDGNGEDMVMLLDKDYDYMRDYSHHLKDTPNLIKLQDGSLKRIYLVLKSSEEFSAEEYSRLIETLINNIIQDGLDNEIDINFIGG